jgi:hypothetical protein
MNGFAVVLLTAVSATIAASRARVLRWPPRVICWSGQQRKPALDQIKPRGAGRCEIEINR